MGRLRMLLAAGLVVGAVLMLSTCSFTGLGESPLPFTKGNGDGSYEVTMTVDNVTNLVPNAEVKVGEVTVGSVRRIEFDDWKAKVVLGLEKGVDLPANAEAKIGQKSLLGASYVQLGPPTTARSSGQLHDGSAIPLSASGRYPETEEVFAALSVVLNGGGLAQVQTISHELNQALSGRGGDVRDLLTQLDVLVGTLDNQKTKIVQTLDGMNTLTGKFAEKRRTVDRALDTLPAAVTDLAADRVKLTRMLRSLSGFGDVASRMIRDGRANLRANLQALRPVLRRLADTGDNLTDWLGAATFPFPSEGLLASNRGDYLNLYVTLDLTVNALKRDWGEGTPLDGIYSGLTGGLPSGPGTDNSNPLTQLPTLPLPKLPGLNSNPGSKPGSGSSGGGLGGLLDGLTGGGG
jgi:phospholipid/cholesterol/gamma-HCH transport system substrate-binding protein